MTIETMVEKGWSEGASVLCLAAAATYELIVVRRYEFAL